MLLKDANSFNMDFLHKPNKNPNSIGTSSSGSVFPGKTSRADQKQVGDEAARGAGRPRQGT